MQKLRKFEAGKNAEDLWITALQAVYPSFARELGVSEIRNLARYCKYRAYAHNVVPYEIVIEYDN
jgi:hypothetical protein